MPACAVLPAVDRSSEPDSAFHNWFYYYFFQSNLAHWFTSKWTATSYLLTFPHLLFFFLAFVGLGVRGSSVLPAVDRSKSSFRDRFSFFFNRNRHSAIIPHRFFFFFFFFFFFWQTGSPRNENRTVTGQWRCTVTFSTSLPKTMTVVAKKIRKMNNSSRLHDDGIITGIISSPCRPNRIATFRRNLSSWAQLSSFKLDSSQ